MRALVKMEPKAGMVLREVPIPTCGPSEALIRVQAAGVCGTDLHIWEWDHWAQGRLRPPVVIGHEFAGRIERLGAEAQAEGVLAVGDLVTAEGHIVCGHCHSCRTGEAHLCSRTRIIGVDRDGAFGRAHRAGGGRARRQLRIHLGLWADRLLCLRGCPGSRGIARGGE
jgi:threonine 3-dehydrogenase